ncbi:c-type cytochrome [Bdellovibrionota bacterium FG-1]
MTDYDGIEEHDNFLPRWWLGILYGSIIFAAGYFAYYSLGTGPSLVQEYAADMRSIEQKKAAVGSSAKAMTEDELKTYIKQPEHRALGQQIFQGKCLPCHGPQGQGNIGPNLTDDYWIHGGQLTDIVKTITTGVADKGMPPWGPLLKPDEIYSVAGYIRSLRGTNPPNPKAPQGEKVIIE